MYFGILNWYYNLTLLTFYHRNLHEMKIHVGKIVSEILFRQHLSKSKFAEKLHYSKQNINALLKKESWNSDTIYRSGVVLNENIFQILASLSGKKKENLQIDNTKISVDKKDFESLKKEVAYLKEINRLLRKKTK